MKILHVIPSFYPAVVYGGPTHSVYGLCRSLVRQGCQIRVLTTDANGPHSVLDVNTSEDVQLSPGLIVRYCHRILDVSVSPSLLRLLVPQVNWAQVVHLTAVYSFPTIPTLLACKVVGRPVVWSPRGMLQRWEGTRRRELKRVWEKACRTVAPNRLLLHATSEQEARECKQRVPGVEMVVVPNGIDVPTTIAHHTADTGLRIVYLGRIDPKKGIDNLLVAYKRATGTLGMTSSLTIAGTGEQQYTDAIKFRIEDLGLSQKVKMIGEVTGDAKEKLFEKADVVAIPSHTENFGMVVAEALAHGVPVIVSRGTPWQRVEEIGCGLWVDNDIESLADAIKRISVMPLLDMGRRGREWMQEEFAWEALAAKMINVYRRLVPRVSEEGGN